MIRSLVALTGTVAALGVAAVAAVSAAVEPPGTPERRIATIARDDNVQALAVTPDGRIVVAGVSGPWTPYPRTFVRVYRASGGLNPGFGQGGEVTLGEGALAAAIETEPDGQILVAWTSPSRIVRLNRDGTRDQTFGTDGVVDVDYSSSFNVVTDLALRPDGRIVVSGWPASSESPGEPLELRGYLADGSPDPGFGTNGRVFIPKNDLAGYSSLALQPDGQILLAVQAGEPELRLARLSADGRLDPNFGRGGFAPLALGRGYRLSDIHPAPSFDWRPLTLPDGRIRVPVTFGVPTYLRPGGVVTRIGLVGLTANGHTDRRFGVRGLALGPRLDVAEGGERPNAAAVDAHGSILVAGSTASADDLSGDDGGIVRRFRADGTLDPSFGRRGLVRGTFARGGFSRQQLALLDDDTLVLIEQQVGDRYPGPPLGGVVRTLNAGHDRRDPSITVRRRCRSISVRIRDLSPLDEVVVRSGRRVVRRTHRKRFRVRLPDGTRRVSVRATDLAENSSTRRVRLPRC